MSNSLDKVNEAIKITQLAQIAAGLITVIKDAMERGDTEVSDTEIAAAFVDKDDALAGLRESIARAKAEGR